MAQIFGFLTIKAWTRFFNHPVLTGLVRKSPGSVLFKKETGSGIVDRPSDVTKHWCGHCERFVDVYRSATIANELPATITICKQCDAELFMDYLASIV